MVDVGCMMDEVGWVMYDGILRRVIIEGIVAMKYWRLGLAPAADMLPCNVPC